MLPEPFDPACDVPSCTAGNPLAGQRMLLAMRIATAGVWLVFGFLFKVCQLLPRHQSIVAAVIGPALAGPATVLIGSAETVMGLWILSRRWPLACAAAQTAAIVLMNTLEIIQARELLLSPV